MRTVSTKLTIGEQCGLFKALGEFYRRRAVLAENAKLDGFFTEFTAKNEGVIEASNRQNNLANLDTADGERDKAFRKFFDVATGAAAQVDTEEAVAGEKVLELLNNYGHKIIFLSYGEKTTKFESLFKDFEMGENAAALEKVHGGVAAKNRLENAEKLFLKIYADKSAKLSELKSCKTATVLKRELCDFYNLTIVPYLQALGVLESEKYTPFIKELDAEVAKANARKVPPSE